MPCFSFSLRYLIAFVGLAVLTVVFASLGNWQLRRAAERDAIAQAIAQGRERAALELTYTTTKPALIPWRPASATGTFEPSLTVLIENRQFEGRPGYWVATPLVLPPLENKRAVLVLRGWIPRPTQPGQPVSVPPAPASPTTIQGDLLERVPRLFELWTWSESNRAALPARLPDPTRPVPLVQNIELDAYAAASGLKLLPIVLAQTAPASPVDSRTMQRQWPEPSLDSNKNRGYALQWFGFAAIAAIAWLVLFWHVVFQRKRRSLSS